MTCATQTLTATTTSPLATPNLFSSNRFCVPNNSTCWPSATDIANFYNALSPEIIRNLHWNGLPGPRLMSVGYGSPGEQPLYGVNFDMRPLYVQEVSDTAGTCFVNNFVSEFCVMGTRNNPATGQPYFIAWPTTVEHVQAAVQFANAHNLCISVAGTGHDFLNRHSCETAPGLFLRMSLMKDHSANLQDVRGPAGTVTFGVGTTFSEAHSITSKLNLYVSSGWATTVGIVGWSLGGGHGPFVPSSGLGVDNVVEAEIVLSNGTLVTANATSNADLFWALRGGGGSTWGIITHLTLKLHRYPEGGVTFLNASISGSFCNGGQDVLNAAVSGLLNWTLTASPKWGGLIFFTPRAPVAVANQTECATWTVFLQYVFAGDYLKDQKFNMSSPITQFPTIPHQAIPYKTWYDHVEFQDTEYLIPVAFPLSGGFPGGVPSVLVNSSVVSSGALAEVISSKLNDCPKAGKCFGVQLYHDITGHPGANQDPNVSISPSFRTALIHFVGIGTPQSEMETFYTLGDSSYFSESAYLLSDWRTRYWGSNYEKLLQIKNKYDPTRRFGCRHCVGDDGQYAGQ